MDYEQLSNLYIIIPAKGVSDVEGYDGDVRVLDNELDTGVKALYDDEAESIIAFLFSRRAYTDETARAWMAEVNEESVNLAIRAAVEDQIKRIGD